MKKPFFHALGLLLLLLVGAQQDIVAAREVIRPMVAPAEDTTTVLAAVQLLEESLKGKNSTVLSGLLHEELVFGHSNGWVQKKSDVIGDMENGSLIYRSFVPESLRIERMGKRAIVKEYVQVQGDRNGNPFNVRLFVLQEWVLGRKGWQLILRQGARLQ